MVISCNYVSKLKLKLFSKIIKYKPDENHKNDVFKCIKTKKG